MTATPKKTIKLSLTEREASVLLVVLSYVGGTPYEGHPRAATDAAYNQLKAAVKPAGDVAVSSDDTPGLYIEKGVTDPDVFDPLPDIEEE